MYILSDNIITEERKKEILFKIKNSNLLELFQKECNRLGYNIIAINLSPLEIILKHYDSNEPLPIHYRYIETVVESNNPPDIYE